jgi:hypothetical protein
VIYCTLFLQALLELVVLLERLELQERKALMADRERRVVLVSLVTLAYRVLQASMDHQVLKESREAQEQPVFKVFLVLKDLPVSLDQPVCPEIQDLKVNVLRLTAIYVIIF